MRNVSSKRCSRRAPRPRRSTYSLVEVVSRRAGSCRTDSTSVRCAPPAPRRPRKLHAVVGTRASSARRARDRCRTCRPARARARPTSSVAARSRSRRSDCSMPYGAITSEKRAVPRTAARGCRRGRAQRGRAAAASTLGRAAAAARAASAPIGRCRRARRRRARAAARCARCRSRARAPARRRAAATRRQNGDVAPAERPRVLPVVERRVLVPALPALAALHEFSRPVISSSGHLPSIGQS